MEEPSLEAITQRIANAIDRIEAASARQRAAPADAGVQQLTERHAKLRAEAGAALAAIDTLIAAQTGKDV